MKVFFGFLIGIVIAVAIAAAAIKVAWGGLTEVGARDKSKDETMTIAATDFDRIEAAGVFEVKVTVGGDYAVTLSGNPDALGVTTAVVEDGVLVLDNAKPDGPNKRRFRKNAITAVIALPALSGFDAAGVVEADVSGVNAEAFNADVSGVGELRLSGTCGALDADVSGVGELDAGDLKCRSVKIDLSGVGEASVYASESVDAEIAGIGSIEIKGSPREVRKEQSSPLGRISVK